MHKTSYIKHLVVLIILGWIVLGKSYGQTSVDLRIGAPQGQFICTGSGGVTVGPPAVISTCAPDGTAVASGLATTCGTTSTCKVIISQVCDSSGVPSNANGRRLATYITSSTFSIATLANSPITMGGSQVACGGGQARMGVLGAINTAATALAGLDPNHRLVLNTLTGMFSSGGNGGLVVSGCVGTFPSTTGCLVTVTTTYAHGVLPVSAGGKNEYFGVWNSGNTALNNAGTGTPGTPYQVASSTTNTFTSLPVTGLQNGDYTTGNLHCGTNGVTWDTINGTETCLVVSQLAYTPKTTPLTGTT